MTVPVQYSLSHENLKARTISSFGFNVSARVFGILIQTVTTLILARILVPEDFGLVGMVMPVIAVFTILGNLGFTNSVLQREHVTPGPLSSLFYINLSVSIFPAGLLFIAAPVIAS